MKRCGGLLLALVMMLSLGTQALASEKSEVVSGFYNIGTAANVEIKAMASTGEVAMSTVDIGKDGIDESLYKNSNRLTVTYTAATTGAFYGLVLVKGNDSPTAENAIAYIDQITATSDEVTFNVFPKDLEETTALTLYITSSVSGAPLVQVALNYAVNEEVAVPEYIPGDIFSDGRVNVNDAIKLAQYLADWDVTLTASEEKAADVMADGKINVNDAIKLAQYLADWDVTLG